jgi:hypothetical protein
VSTQQTKVIDQANINQKLHEQSVDITGLDDIFKWASDVVAEGNDDSRVRLAREKRIRTQVLSIVQKAKEDKVLADANHEINYLQRRVIALLTKLQEVVDENSLLKQIMLTQLYSIQQMPAMEAEIRELKTIQCEKDSAVSERRYLMDGLTKLKVERDYLEDVLMAAENENCRLAKNLKYTREELVQSQAKKWWHSLKDSLQGLVEKIEDTYLLTIKRKS